MDPNLYRAGRSGDWEAVRNFLGNLYTQRTTNGNTILHVLAQSRDSPADAVRQILAQKPDLGFQTNKKRETPLIIASKTGNLDVVRALIEFAKGNDNEDGGCWKATSCSGTAKTNTKRVAKMLKAVSGIGNFALHEAVINDHYDVVKFLVEEDPNIKYYWNKAWETPLYIAVEKGNDRIANLIVSTLKWVNPLGPLGKTAMHAAATRNSAECMRLILKLRLDLTNKVDVIGWAPIHYAAKFNQVEMVKLLLSADKSAGYFTTKADKKTALHIAAASGHVDVIREILLHCPDCWETLTKKRQSVLHLAVENEHKEVLEFILEHSWISDLINQKDVNRNTPLHLYVGTKKLKGCNLVNHPLANRNAFNFQGLTPLDMTTLIEGEVSQRKNEIKDELVKAGATPGFRKLTMKPEAPAEKGNTETHMVVATLILTVSFAAAFTVPGGYDSNGKGSEGMAILSKQGAFIAFVVSDSLAMLFSTCALFEMFWEGNEWAFLSFSDTILSCKFYLTLALTFLMIAFLAGLYAVLPVRALKIYLLVSSVLIVPVMPIYIVMSFTSFLQCLRERFDENVFSFFI